MAPSSKSRGKKSKHRQFVDDFDEPPVEWKHSNAKKLLHDDIVKKKVPLHAKDENGKSTMELSDVYLSNPELKKYHYKKIYVVKTSSAL